MALMNASHFKTYTAFDNILLVEYHQSDKHIGSIY